MSAIDLTSKKDILMSFVKYIIMDEKYSEIILLSSTELIDKYIEFTSKYTINIYINTTNPISLILQLKELHINGIIFGVRCQVKYKDVKKTLFNVKDIKNYFLIDKVPIPKNITISSIKISDFILKSFIMHIISNEKYNDKIILLSSTELIDIFNEFTSKNNISIYKNTNSISLILQLKELEIDSITFRVRCQKNNIDLRKTLFNVKEIKKYFLINPYTVDTNVPFKIQKCTYEIIKHKPNNFCRHDKHKKYCKECDGSALCKSVLCETIINKKCQGYCMYCFVHLFPDQLIFHNRKTKEKMVTDLIKHVFPTDDWRFDKTITDGCSRKRPDALLDMGSHVLIVEIDENRHSYYDCICENKRIMQLSLDVGHRPIVFLRFNPDSNDTSPSCFTLHKQTGLLYIPHHKQKEWNKRINSLLDQIKYWKENIVEKIVEVIELYY